MIRIRTGLEREDWSFLREVCCQTGDAGGPIADRSRWAFFGEQWIGPYEKLRPEWTYLAEEFRPVDLDVAAVGGPSAVRGREPSRRLGYLTGCPDTMRFECERRWLFDLPLDLRIRAGSFSATVDTERFLDRFEGSFRNPLRNPGPEAVFRIRHGAERSRSILEEFPAHLHMNLVSEARGTGVGRRLVETFQNALAAQGIRGIHLYCGPKPRGFYERIGFRLLDEIEFRPGIPIYRLGLRF